MSVYKRLAKLGIALALIFVVNGMSSVQAENGGIDLSAVSASTVDPVTHLAPAQWIKVAQGIINGKAVVGKPEVFMINATGVELNSVICDGRWQLVGSKPYIEGAPASLPAWKVTIVPTVGFDGYCKTSIKGQSDNGDLFKADLVSSDGTFTNAVYLVFKPN
jgi:hypothetical protein